MSFKFITIYKRKCHLDPIAKLTFLKLNSSNLFIVFGCTEYSRSII